MLTVWWIIVCSCLVSVVICDIDLEVGDDCSLLSGEKGICTNITKCQSHATTLLARGGHPKICGFDGVTPIICCPILEIPRKKPNPSQYTRERQRISDRECYKLYPYPVYAILTPGGKPAVVSEFKHMALIGFGDKNDIQWQCGGSLVSLTFVMTAAHCLFSPAYGPPKWVRLGDLDILNDTDGSEPQQIHIKRTIPHPEYQIPSKYHDIALLELETPAKHTNFVAPACLDTNRTHSEKQMIATGWGRTRFTGEFSNHLLKTDLDLVPVDRCREFYKESPPTELPDGIDDDLQICAGGGPLKDTCQGDSGGPLQIISPYRSIEKPYMIVGVTSFGKACGLSPSPGVYTRVYSHLTWLEENIWPT